MDIFSFFKKNKDVFKPVATAAVKENKTVAKYMKDHNVNTFNEPLNKLTDDGELPFGWYSHHQNELKKHENQITHYAQLSRTGTVNEKIINLKKLIQYYNNFKKYCYSKDECYKKYFSDMYEHCYNSRNRDFEYITSFKNDLEELLNTHVLLCDTEKRRQLYSKNLKNVLFNFLRNHNGILQKDIYKNFDDSIKSDIQTLLYEWEKSGRIKREKVGNTYKIIIK